MSLLTHFEGIVNIFIKNLYESDLRAIQYNTHEQRINLALKALKFPAAYYPSLLMAALPYITLLLRLFLSSLSFLYININLIYRALFIPSVRQEIFIYPEI